MPYILILSILFFNLTLNASELTPEFICTKTAIEQDSTALFQKCLDNGLQLNKEYLKYTDDNYKSNPTLSYLDQTSSTMFIFLHKKGLLFPEDSLYEIIKRKNIDKTYYKHWAYLLKDPNFFLSLDDDLRSLIIRRTIYHQQDFTFLKLLLSSGIDVNFDHARLLSFALSNQNYDMVKYLFERGAVLHPSTGVSESYDPTVWELDSKKTKKLIDFYRENGIDVLSPKATTITLKNGKKVHHSKDAIHLTLQILADDPPNVEHDMRHIVFKGKRVYNTVCSTCHASADYFLHDSEDAFWSNFLDEDGNALKRVHANTPNKIIISSNPKNFTKKYKYLRLWFLYAHRDPCKGRGLSCSD